MNNNTPKLLILALPCALLISPFLGSDVRAHATGETYVWVTVEEDHLHGRFEVNFTDIQEKLKISLRPNESLEDAAHRMAAPVQQYIRDHFVMTVSGEQLSVEFTDVGIYDGGGEGRFAAYHFRTSKASIPDEIQIRNELFFENDRLHRGLLMLTANRKAGIEYGEENIIMLFSPGTTEQVLDLNNVRALLRPRQFVWQGILHIWIGIDHILFLVALLLPAVLTRDEGKWKAVATFRSAFWNVLKIVTVFTIAHSITLGLAALEIVQLPSRLVESVIALSIVLVVLNTIYPMFRESSWIIIFLFGLFHGLGFASVMGDLMFRIVDLVKVLICFNVGVELGQVAIVACAFPVMFLLRNSKAYLPLVLRGGSLAIGLVACWWFVERAFGL